MYNSLEKFFELVGYGTENNKWDYKRDIHMSPNTAFANLLKDILAFANSGGGWLILGVDDDCSIRGVETTIDQTSLGQKLLSITREQIVFDLNYYNLHEGSEKTVGLLYVHDSEKVLVSPVDLYDEKRRAIVSEDTIYFRRNASSIKANIDDINTLIYKVSLLGKYELNSEDIKFLKSKKSEYSLFKDEDDFFEGKFEFSVAKFADKLNSIFRLHQSKYTKYEIGILLGFEINAINDYFEGKRFPKIEHLLRAVEIFDLPHDFFFQPTIAMEMPFIHNPLITHVILEKAVDKVELYEFGFGTALNKIFSDTAKEFSYFKKWLFCSDRNKFKPNKNDFYSLTYENRMIHETYESYLENVGEIQYNKFKEHLQTQYYKEIERTSDVDERYLHEKIKTNLMSSDTGFIYEVQNRILLYREYDSHILKVNFSENYETLDELR